MTREKGTRSEAHHYILSFLQFGYFISRFLPPNTSVAFELLIESRRLRKPHVLQLCESSSVFWEPIARPLVLKTGALANCSGEF